LPKIINGLKKFFTDNKWIIDTVKFTIKILGDGIMGMVWLVTEYPKGVQKNMMNELKWAKNEFDKIINIADNAYKIWDDFYGGKPDSPSGSGGPLGGPLPNLNSPPTKNGSGNGPSYQPYQKFARGGTVKKPSKTKTEPNKPSKSTVTSGFRGATSTPMGKKAIETTDSFDTFATVAEQVKEHSVLLDGKGGVNENFTGVNNSLDQFLNFLKQRDLDKKKSPSGGGTTPPDPTSSAPSIPGNGKVRGGAIVTDPDDPDYQDSGMDIALPDSRGGYGIGALIQNPFESLKITKVGFQGHGSGDTGQGFGLYITGEAVVDGKRYELLVGHLDKAHVKEGDVLSGGDSIGEQGISGHATGPHVSTHINSLDGGNAKSILKAVENSWTKGTLIKSQNMKPGKGGIGYMNPKTNRRSPLLSKNMDESSMAMGAVDFFVTQVIEKPVPMPVPFRVNSSGGSKNNTIPEINPLLLV